MEAVNPPVQSLHGEVEEFLVCDEGNAGEVVEGKESFLVRSNHMKRKKEKDVQNSVGGNAEGSDVPRKRNTELKEYGKSFPMPFSVQQNILPDALGADVFSLNQAAQHKGIHQGLVYNENGDGEVVEGPSTSAFLSNHIKKKNGKGVQLSNVGNTEGSEDFMSGQVDPWMKRKHMLEMKKESIIRCNKKNIFSDSGFNFTLEAQRSFIDDLGDFGHEEHGGASSNGLKSDMKNKLFDSGFNFTSEGQNSFIDDLGDFGHEEHGGASNNGLKSDMKNKLSHSGFNFAWEAQNGFIDILGDFGHEELGGASNNGLKSDMKNKLSHSGFNFAWEAQNSFIDILGDFGHEEHGGSSNSDLKFDMNAQFNDLPLLGVGGSLQEQEPETSQYKHFIDDESINKYKLFKSFDIVDDFSDHYYTCDKSKQQIVSAPQPSKSKDWSMKIQHEWNILQKNLPEGIYVRVYEHRMDLLRAAIIGPSGSPYHDALFFFDVLFPDNYPDSPPDVHYHSGGLRLNPNLYNSGKVCLSLLGTWPGQDCERWNPQCSSMLQVLVSIQALVLNSNPFFNEPCHSNLAGTPQGEIDSIKYNKDAFLLSCKTMLFSLRNPPKRFAEFVVGHFFERRHKILAACEAYMNGAHVGCVDGNVIQDADDGDKTSSARFRVYMKVIMEKLMSALPIKGEDCSQDLHQKVDPENDLDTSLRL